MSFLVCFDLIVESYSFSRKVLREFGFVNLEVVLVRLSPHIAYFGEPFSKAAALAQYFYYLLFRRCCHGHRAQRLVHFALKIFERLESLVQDLVQGLERRRAKLFQNVQG